MPFLLDARVEADGIQGALRPDGAADAGWIRMTDEDAESAVRHEGVEDAPLTKKI